MPKTIISILGTSGAKFDAKACLPVVDDAGDVVYQSALYEAEELGVADGEFRNATEFVLERYEGRFFFIGTACAITFQKQLLAEVLEGKDVTFVTIEDNSLDDIFETVLELLSKHDDIVLDITHGFRHQPIMAIFASTLSQFLHREELQIIFAKEIERFKVYAYIYLDAYIDITQLSLLLTGFIRTLNFIPLSQMKLLDNRVFENFSKSLLANDLRGVEKNYALLSKELEKLEQNPAFSHIKGLLTKVKKELTPLNNFANMHKHNKYLTLAKMMVEKNYLIIALAYVFESLRSYSDASFGSLTQGIHYKDDFERKNSVMDAITNAPYARKDNKIYKAHTGFYDKNKTKLSRITKVYLEIRKLRNSLAHINEHKEFDDIKKMVFGYIFKVESIYKEDDLKHLEV